MGWPLRYTLDMAARSPQRRATYADLEALPPNQVGEIVRGVLYASPRPASPHAAAASAVGEELGPPFKRGRGGPGGWVILDEPELHLHDDVLVPDLGGWRRERMPEMPQVAAFVVLSFVSIQVYRKWFRKAARASDQPLLNRRAEQAIGLVAPLEQAIVGGRGRIKLGDAFWVVEGPDLPAGTAVRVVAVNGMVLKVQEA